MQWQNKRKYKGCKVKFKPHTLTRVDKNYIERKSPDRYYLPKYLNLCKEALDIGYDVFIYCSKSSNTKYVYICKDEKFIKIRVSDHSETKKDCHYYIGKDLSTYKLIYMLKNDMSKD